MNTRVSQMLSAAAIHDQRMQTAERICQADDTQAELEKVSDELNATTFEVERMLVSVGTRKCVACQRWVLREDLYEDDECQECFSARPGEPVT